MELEAERERIAARLAGGRGRVHLVGVCGVGMAGVAFHLARRGFQVSGCDCAPGALAGWLEARGIPVAGGHDPAHAAAADWMVRSAAVRPDHPELAAAAARGAPVFRRGLVLAALLSGCNSVAVCGAHGKTTTTSMLVQLLRGCGLAPSFCIGGESAALGGVAGAAGSTGAAGIFVAEADESDGTLAGYAPDIAVLTNLEFDHAEHFENLDALRACYAALARAVKRRLVYCADDPEARRLGAPHPRGVAYGIERPADWRAAQVVESGAGAAFDVILRGRALGRLTLPVPGKHNVLNALAACAAAEEWRPDFADVCRALGRFEPVRRRFERVLDADGLLVFSDYAHHPSEIATVLGNLKHFPRARWRAVFQPHRFSRTRALGPALAQVFEGLDELILAPVYAASEPEQPGGTAWDLYAQLRQAGKVRTICATSPAQAWGYLRGCLRAGDGLLIIGAGDVGRMAERAQADFRRAGLAGLDPAAAWREELAGLELEHTLIRAGESFERRSTLHVGGKADIFLEVGLPAELARIVGWARRVRAPWTVVGAGSNILASDLGVRGVVIRLAGAEFCRVSAAEAGRMIAGAGAPLRVLTERAAGAGRAGLEFLTGIPGTVGGALRMNAGAWGREIGGAVEWVRCLEPDGSESVFGGRDLPFAYRECPALAGRIVLEAALATTDDAPEAIRGRMEDFSRRRAWLSGTRSAGSVFRNPAGDFAGRLMEQAGLKGLRVGGARVAERHANVIVTENGATASDVLALMEMARRKVRAASGIELVGEIAYLE